ncbi:MAG: TMEM43 family protein [Candidatus Magasanikbacteria bacterium]
MPPIEPNNVVNSVTTTTKTGYFSRIGSSVKGIFFGFLIFIASFVVLYWNEGKVDKSDIASTATEISATSLNTDSALEGKLIHVNGDLSTENNLSDSTYLKEGKYLALNRKVEVYSWVEESSSNTKTNVGGSQTTDTTYTYKKDWVNEATDSSTFQEQKGHENVDKSLDSNTWYASSAKIGVYEVAPARLTMPGYSEITLTKENTVLPVVIVPTTTTKTVPQNDLMKALSASDDDLNAEFGTNTKVVEEVVIPEKTKNVVLNGNYVYVTEKNVSTPTIGDMRVSYSAVASPVSVTLLGRLNNNKIIAMTDAKTGVVLYRAFTGTFEDALATLHTEYKTALWIFRVIGFLMMWIGLAMILAPLSVLLDVLPIFGTISRSVVGLVTFLVALVLSIVTIVVSMVLHNPLVLVIVVLAVIIYVVKVIKKAKQKPQTVS